MNMRGKRAEPLDKDATKVNVTSCNAKTHPYRLDFSPMTAVKGGYKGYWNFESYWQSGKKFEGLPHASSKRWWRQQTKPKRRYPGAKGRKVEYAEFGDAVRLDYVASRKKVYVPEYAALVKGRRSLVDITAWVKAGRSVTVYDFDGPRDAATDGPLCLELTKALLREKINNTRHPFGHGYVIAACAAGIEPSEYI
jgi:hypothetical protein